MERTCNPELHRENMRLCLCPVPESPAGGVAAWGTIIEKRDYLWTCLEDMIALKSGIRRPMGHLRPPLQGRASPPPLYLRADSVTEPFDPEAYVLASIPGPPRLPEAAGSGYEERPWEKTGLTSARLT